MSGKALPQVDKNKTMREYLRNVRNGKADREILLNANPGDTNTIEASGAINLTIVELIPTCHEGTLELPADLNIMTGVVGNEGMAR